MYGQSTLLGALGVIGLDLETDQSSYTVGEKPLYTITGAIPGSRVAWSSWKDEEPTSEYLTEYGQTIGANGTLEIEGAAWTENDIGRWQKEIVVIAPDTTDQHRAQVFFIVRAVSTAEPGTPAPISTGGLFSQRISLFGYDLPLIGVLAAGGLGFYFLSKQR